MPICTEKPATPAEAFKIMERTIAKLAHKWARNHYQDFDDLFQFGCEGLMVAYNRFDPTKDCAFSSYAYQWISAVIGDKTKLNWKQYNNTNGYVSVEDTDENEYEMDLDTAIDLNRKIDAQDMTTQVIIRARICGYSFREISEMLEKEGVNKTLHQCRNIYLSVMGNE